MKALQRQVLEQLIAGLAEPIVIAGVDRPEWPVVLCNEAFAAIAGGEPADGRPFADVVEQLVGRELALEVSETVRVQVHGVDLITTWESRAFPHITQL